MAVFSYKAIDWDASPTEGTIAADTPRAARDQLRQRGLAVRSIEPVRRAASRGGLSLRLLGRRCKAADLTAVFSDLSTLLTAGIPLLEALDTVAGQQRGRLKAALQALRERVAAGASLHEAMAEQPELFDPMCVNLIEVGHNTGTLELALERLADYRQRAEQTRGRVVTALIYPAIIVVVGLAVTAFLMTFVVPNLLDTLVQAGRPLPGPTVVVKAVSDLLIGWWWAILAGLAVAVIGVRLVLRTPRGRTAWDRLVLRLPLVGTLIRKETIARMSVVLSTLLRSGLPFDQSLRITRRTLSNRCFVEALERCDRAVQAGAELSRPLAESGVFPATVVRIIAVGQETGELETMLERLAGRYDQQVATASARLTAALEPLIIVLLAVLVGFVAFATILPILEASNVF